MPWAPKVHAPRLCRLKCKRRPGRPGRPEQRASASKRGYGRGWQRYRRAYLASHPLCECGPECCPGGCHQPAAHVDHVEAVDGPDDPRFWAPENHRALSHACHSRKTVRQDGGFGRRPGRRPGRRGPARAGKTV